MTALEHAMPTARDGSPSPSSSPDPVPLRPLDERLPEPVALPQPLSSFIGREHEIASVVARLRRDEVRLLTLTGPGGVGKTRLALAVTGRVATNFPEAIVFVPLASLGSAAFVASAIAQRLGVREEAGQDLLEQLGQRLGAQRLLLVLDNFEHVLPAAPLVTEWLTTCPGLKILVTSRAPLHLSGEHVYAVPPLVLPDPGSLLSLDALAQNEAVRLFVVRAQAVKVGFSLTAENAPAIAEICRRLDGLPLAVELAAARVPVLPPAALLARLERSLPLLTGGAQDLPDRQRTLRDTIAWSYALLPAHEQALFRRMAVFAGGCTLEAAEAACITPGDVEIDVLEAMTSLVDHHLVQVQGTEQEVRFGMLATVREFGLERLQAAGETDEIRTRLGEYLVALAKRTDPLISESYNDRNWLDFIELEDDNFWSVLTWSLESGDVEVGLRIADAMSLFWYLRKRRLTEARIWLDRALESGRYAGVSDSVLALALACASTLAHLQDDAEQAVALAEESLAIFERLGTSISIARVRYILAIAVYMQGDCSRAERLYDEAIEQFRAEGDRYFVAEALLGAARVALDRGDLQRAAAAYEESLQASQQLGSKSCAAMAQSGLGFLARSRGDRVAAHRHFQDSLAIWSDINDPASIAVCLEALASTLCSLGAPWRAARLLGAAEALREQISYPIPRGALPTYQQTVAGIQDRLSMLQFATAWAEGRSLSPAEALALAREALPDHAVAEDMTRAPGSLRTSRALSRGLTPRELEVLRLVVIGQTNRQIAEALSISVPTVKRHLTNILGKLDLPSRSALTAYAHTHDLA